MTCKGRKITSTVFLGDTKEKKATRQGGRAQVKTALPARKDDDIGE